MGVYIGQWSVPGTSLATVCTFQIPPGPYNIVLYNVNANTFYMAVGTSSTTPPPSLSTANGMIMHSIPTSWNGYQGSPGGYLWVITNQGTASSFNYVLSTQER